MLGPSASVAHLPATVASASSSKLIVLDLSVEGVDKRLRALLDTGASNNFVRSKSLEGSSISLPSSTSVDSELLVRLADGTQLSVPKSSITLQYSFENLKGKDDFLLLDLDDRFDIILGLPWCQRHQPFIDWNSYSVQFPSSSLDAFLAFEDSLFASENEDSLSPVCDGPACKEMPTVSVSNRFSALEQDDDVHDDDRDELFSFQHVADSFSPPNGKKPMRKSSKKKKLFMPGPGKPLSKMPVRKKSFSVLNSLYVDGTRHFVHRVKVQDPPNTAAALTAYPCMTHDEFVKAFNEGEITQVCIITTANDPLSSNELATHLKDRQAVETVATSSQMDQDVLDDKTRKERYESQTWEKLQKSCSVYDVISEFKDVFPEEVPSELPVDRGIRHEIDLEPGTKYCVTRQWPLPKDQVEAIDKFFEQRRKAGHVRESNSPHCSPTFCVKKATGGWRIVHAFNKLNDATIPAQTPVPRKDMIIDSMTRSTVFSALDLMDGYYQTLMRDKDIPLTAVSTPSGMLWEWLVMPQGLKNAPATFNRMVSHILRPFRDFAPSYFDDVFIHSKAQDGKTDLENHKMHLRAVLTAMRKNKLYANLKKCIFAVPEIPVLGCIVGKHGVRPDPEKVKVIAEWPVPRNVKQLRQFLGLANYLHKYSRNYAAIVRPLTQLLRDDIVWKWLPEQQTAFDHVKRNLQEAPILALPDYDKPFHVVCDASKFAIGCALMQHDDEGKERVVSYQSRQLKNAETRYPVHDKELLAIKYALVKFRVYLMGETRFAVYTDHASLRYAMKSPHLSQRMARWLSFFAEYNFVVHYKPGKNNILADALSRRPDYDSQNPESTDHSSCRACDEAHAIVRAQSPLPEEIARAYEHDSDCKQLLAYLSEPSDKAFKSLPSRLSSRLHRYSLHDGLLYYAVDPSDPPRIVVPLDEDLRTRILYEFHDSPTSGHLGREKTFLAISRDFYWPHMYKWVRKYVRTCDMCQRVKPSPSNQAPLHSLPIPSDNWDSISMDFIFGFPPDVNTNTGIVVFVDRFSKMVHINAVKETISAEETAKIFLDTVFRHHGMPREIVSDRDPRFTSRFWRALFRLVGTKLSMSTAAHPETDGQTERVNRVLEDVLNSFAHSFTNWSDLLPLAEFALNNAVHASTGHTPFYMNHARHPRLPSLLGDSTFVGGETSDSRPSSTSRKSLRKQTVADATAIEANFEELSDMNKMSKREQDAINDFVLKRETILRFVRDAIAEAVDKQKEQADKRGRKHKEVFKINDLVLLSTANLPKHALSNMQSTKFQHRFIGPFKVLKRHGDAYTLDIPRKMRLHPTFYVGRLKRYRRSDLHEDIDESSLSLSFRKTNEQSEDHSSLREPSRRQHPKPPSASADASRASRVTPTFPPIQNNVSETSPSTVRSPERSSLSLNPRSRNDSPRGEEQTGNQSRVSRVSRVARRRSARLQQFSTQVDSHEHPARAPTLPSLSLRERSSRQPLVPMNELDQTSYRDPRNIRGNNRSNAHPRFSQRSGPPPLVDSHGDERWIVDSIVGHRLEQKRRNSSPRSYEFRVRWLGYPPEQDSWLPRFVLEADIPEELEDYEKQHF